MGRTNTPSVWPPPAQVIRTRTCSLAPCACTSTRSTTCRIISLRSASVVVEALRSVGGALAALLPELGEAGTVLFDLFRGSQRYLQGSWCERGQDVLGDKRVQRRARHMLTERFAVMVASRHTVVGEGGRTPMGALVMHPQLRSTPYTDHQSRQ